MANIINRQQTFLTNGTVTAAGLHNLIDTALVNSAIIKNQQEITTIGTADLLLIAPDSVDSSLAPRKVTVQNLIDDAFSVGTFTSLNLTSDLTYGTATGNRTVSTSATITTGTIPTLVSKNATIGTTTGTAGVFTSGTITTGLIPTLTAGTTTGTAGVFTSGTIATLNSTTGTITNLSTTLAGDFTISQGTATLSTTGATAGTYGTTGIIPTISVDAKGRITTIGTAFGGKILQVVEATYSTQVSTSSTSHSDTGLSASITPSSASNKIIVLANQNYFAQRSTTSVGHAVKLVRTIGTNSSDITTNSSGYDSAYVTASGSGATLIGLGGYVTIAALDSPSTTSQCTYKTQGRIYLAALSGIVYYQESSSPSRIILAEVAS